MPIDADLEMEVVSGRAAGGPFETDHLPGRDPGPVGKRKTLQMRVDERRPHRRGDYRVASQPTVQPGAQAGRATTRGVVAATVEYARCDSENRRSGRAHEVDAGVVVRGEPIPLTGTDAGAPQWNVHARTLGASCRTAHLANHGN